MRYWGDAVVVLEWWFGGVFVLVLHGADVK